MVNLKNTVLAFFCMVLCGCFVNHLLNYPFRVKENIASLPIDFDGRDSLVFEFDNIKSDKIFYLYRDNLQGPYSVDICTDDDYIDNFNVKITVTMIVGGIEHKTVNTCLFYGGAGCDAANGWTVGSFSLPKDFDRNQKLTIILQILEDKDEFLKKLKNPKLVLWAGTGIYYL